MPFTDWESNVHSMTVQRGHNTHALCDQPVQGISVGWYFDIALYKCVFCAEMSEMQLFVMRNLNPWT